MKKFLFVLLCTLLLLGTVACVSSDEKGYEEQKDLPNDTIAKDTVKTYEEQKTLYNDIIAKYTELLIAKQNGEEPAAPSTEGMNERERAIAEALYGIVTNMSTRTIESGVGYGYKDYDENGIPELLLCTNNNAVLAIFTISDEMPVLLAARSDRTFSIYYVKNNRFLMERTTTADATEECIFSLCYVDGEKLGYDTVLGSVFDHDKEEEKYFKIIDGNRISVPRADVQVLYDLYYDAINRGDVTSHVIANLSAPRIYLPLENAPESTDLPIADFSTYEAIRETCQRISSTVDDFTRSNWLYNHYDNLFSYPDDRSFDYYNRLIYAAYCGGRFAGYDEIDLNGDGQSELVLMDEDYRIKALFTQKKGVPVLLDAFAYETCWLDEEGYIHIDREDYSELEYSLYELTSDSEYKLVYSVLAANNDKRYLTKDGETKRITFEESLEIYYDGYCRYFEPFEPNEHTRNVSVLTYTPFVTMTEESKDAAMSYEWHKYANMTKTSGKDLAYSNTFVTFEKEAGGQTYIHFKYRFTFHYPDPDRDHYLLDDVTESNLKLTLREENGTLVFDGSGIKGKVELFENCLWVIIEESTDERFCVGHHCYEISNT